MGTNNEGLEDHELYHKANDNFNMLMDESGLINAQQAEQMGIDKVHYERMTKRDKTVPWLIYPENKYKSAWDLWMTLVLIVTCIMTTLEIAFNELENNEIDSGPIIDYIIDSIFFIISFTK